MTNESGEKVGPATKPLKFSRDFPPQFPCGFGDVIGQAGILAVPPDLFVRIEFGGIRREANGLNIRMVLKKFANDQGSIMHVAAIPDQRHRFTQMEPEILKKSNRVLGMYVLIVGQEIKVESETLAYRADSDRADGGDPIPPIPVSDDRRMPAGRVRSTHRGREHEPGLIEEYQAGASNWGLHQKFFRIREIVA